MGGSPIKMGLNQYIYNKSRTMEHYFKIEKVADYLKFRNQKPLHPLIGLVDFYQLDQDINRVNTQWDGLDFDCYAIFLKDNADCKLKYGGNSYDFDEGTMVFIGPQQRVGMVKGKAYQPKGYALLFHPDLLSGSDLEKGIAHYTYFSYSVNEALHLSNKEREVVVSLLEKIQFELEQNIDKHSKKLILSNLSLLLDYCMRFYDRQFITRELPHHTAMRQFDHMLEDYFFSSAPQEFGLPSVQYFADKVHLSANYFGDLVRKAKGVSAQEYIQDKLIAVAKIQVVREDLTINEIAFGLGFKYPQHFSRLFKKKMGCTPKAYRLSAMN